MYNTLIKSLALDPHNTSTVGIKTETLHLSWHLKRN